MRKILRGAVTLTGLSMLTASGASSAQSNGSAVMHVAPAHGIATNVYYRRRWHDWRWRHWHHWHHRYHWY
jgi:hypothetical protein